MNKIWTVLEIVNWGTEYFKKNNISSPRLNIELLICELLKFDRVSIYTNYQKPLNAQELDKLRDWVKRRAKHEPLEYIMGKKNFCDVEIMVDPSVLIPRPETEQIITEAEKLFDNDDEIEILDIGTGSGCIAVQLAKSFPNSKVYAVDVDQSALTVAQNNSRNNDIKNLSFKKTDILKDTIDYKFDLIVSNPPYISKSDYNDLEKNVKDYEPAISLTDNRDGLTFYEKYSLIFKNMLRKNGKFILEFAQGQDKQIAEIFEDKGYYIEVVEDFSGIKRFCIGNFISI